MGKHGVQMALRQKYIWGTRMVLKTLNSWRRTYPKFVSSITAIFLMAMTLTAFDPAVGAFAATSDPCNGTSTQNQLKVSASHGSVFYIDSATSEKMDAAYLSYVVSGVSGASTKTNLWVEVSNFQGGSVDLTTPDDSVQSLGSIAASSSKTAFFLVRATAPTLRAQTHVVKVYSGKPGLATTSELYSCTFSFTKVKETIKANANKVTNVTTTPATTSNLPLGSTFDVTVTGDTGTIGSGSAPDSDMMWISPVARSSWPSQAIRLESSVIKFSDTANGVANCSTEGTCKFTNQLLISGLLAKANAIKNNAKSLNYQATYTFRVIGKTAAGVPILPIAQISSGTQTKHTPIPASALSTIDTNTIAINATLSKTVSATVTNSVVSGVTTQNFGYKLTLMNSGTGSISVDQIVDAKDSRLNYKAASVSASTFPGSSGGSGTTVSAIEPALDSATGKLVFAGPYTIPANSRLEISYTMQSTCTTGSFSYTNSATANIGALTIGSTATTFSQVVATGSCGDTTITPVVTNTTLLPEDVTLNASAVADTTATLNGTVDPNGISGGSIQYLYGTDPTLTTFTAVSAGTTTTDTTPYAVSANITSLSTATRYYFRIKTTVTVSGTTSSQYGDILSFLTTEPAGTPTIQTDPATGVSASTATINGTIDPNLTTSIAGFTISTNSNMSSATSYMLRDDMTTAYNSSTNPYTSFAGSFPTAMTLDVTQVRALTAGTTYYYRADIFNSSGTILYSGAVRSFTAVVYSDQTITFNSITSQSINTGSITVSPTATSTLGTVVTSETPNVCTVTGPTAGAYIITFVSVGDCTLDANQDGGLVGGTNYYAATPVVQTFSITRAVRTLTIDSSSFNSSYTDWASSPPQITSTASAGNTDGTKSYSIPTTTTICSIDSATGVVTFLKPGTCSVQATISQGTNYLAASSTVVNFTIGKKTQVLSLGSTSQSLSAGSYSLSASTNATTNTSGLGSYVYSFTGGQTNTASCSLATSTLSFTTTGICYITATRTGNDFWTDATTTATVTVTAKYGRSLAIKRIQGGTPVDLPTSVTDWSVAAPVAQGVPDHSEVSDTFTYSLDASSTGCSVNSSTGEITYTGAGTCKVLSSVNEGTTYNGATSSIATIVIGKRTQQINNFSNGSASAPTGHFDLTATSNATTADSGMAANVTYSIAANSTEGCAIVGTQVTFTKAGVCHVTATRHGNANWTDAEATIDVSVGRGSRSLTLSNYSNSYTDWVTQGPSLLATSDYDDNDGAKSFALDASSQGCTVDSVTGAVTFTSAGTCVVVSTIAQGNRYNSATSSTASLTIGKRPQVLTFDGANVSVSSTSTSLVATTDALTLDTGLGNYVYSLDTAMTNTTGCAVSGSTLQFTTQGDCYVKVTKSGNAHWQDGSKTAHFVINGKSNRNIRILTKTDNTTDLTATGSYDPSGYSNWSASGPRLVSYVPSGDREAGDVYTYELDNDSTGCTVDANTGQIQFTGAGTCKVHSHVSENTNHNAALSSSISFTVGKKDQHITGLVSSDLEAPTNQTTLAAVSDATTNDLDLGTVTYSIESGSTAGCSISGNAVVYTQVGQCVVKASRSGGANWNAASQTVTYNINRSSRALNFNPSSYSPSRTYTHWGVTPPQLVSEPTAGGGDGTVSYSLATGSTACTVDSSTGQVTFTGAGLCKVSSNMSQGNKYNAAVATVLEITVGKKTQHILTHNDATVSAPVGNYTLGATSDTTSLDSDIADVDYSIGGINNAGCSISATRILTFTQAGTCTVVAHRNSNSHWTDASSTVLITVERANRTANINAAGNATTAVAGSSVNFSSSPSQGTGLKTWSAGPSSVCTINSSGVLTTVSAGVCSITATHAQTGTHNAANASMTFNVTAGPGGSSPSPTPSGSASATPTPTPSVSPSTYVAPRPNPSPSSSPSSSPTPSPSAAPSATPKPLPTPQIQLPTIGNSVVPGAPARTTKSVDKVDNGNGKKVTTTPQELLSAQAPSDSLGSNQLSTIPKLAAETFTGFAGGSGTWVEVIGAKTTAQFILTPEQIADSFTVARAINESTDRTATNFAKITGVTAVATPNPKKLLTGPATEDATNTFAASQLDNPKTLGDLDLANAKSWLKLDAQVSTYKPGTVIYLAVTTQPIILGAAIVGKDGTANLSGYLPVDLLPDGGHNIRVVGTRSLDGISTDANGKVKVSNSTLSEIQRFDAGTVSTVKVLGQNSTGGLNGAIREIKLDKNVPWWTIWLLMVFIVTALGIRLFAKKWTFTGRVVAATLVSLATIPAIILGWITSSYEVIWIGLVLSVLSNLTTWVFPKKNLRSRKQPRS